MSKYEKAFLILGLVAVFTFMLVAGYCGIYIVEYRKESEKRAVREAARAQRMQEIMAECNIVISDEKPEIIISDYDLGKEIGDEQGV